MKFKRTGWALALLGAAAALGSPSDVSACGGCFTGPTTVQVVTDHRMVLSVSTTQTTLWDQFQYSGAAADFSWILPIRYTDRTQIAQADDGFMRMADGLTAPVITPPSRPFCGRGPQASNGGFADAAAAGDGGVTVLRQEVVGPYAVSIIRGADPMAVRDWLRSNGYTVPSAVEPIIDHYTAMRMDYVALRLRPGEGINRMSPIRVTLDGAQPVLPLRMIAAGVADRVGLSLVVISSSRYEAQNFPNGEIAESELTWDFSRPGSPAADFLNAFNALNRANGDRLWLTETATTQSRTAWESAAPGYRNPVRPGGPFGGFDGGVTPPPPVDAGDDVADASDASATDPIDDVRVAFAGLGDSAVVTRFRANMLASMLTADLQLRASDRGLRPINYTYGRLLNDPGPTCSGSTTSDGGVVDAGTSEDVGLTVPASTEGGVRCAASPGRAPREHTTRFVFAGLALAALGLRARRRR